MTLFSYFIRFDLELDKFDVDVQVLKDPVILRELLAGLRTGSWEKELKKKNCPVVEAQFLTKYKNLSFLLEDYNKVYTIFEGNMEFHHGKSCGWMLLGECSEEGVEDEGFCPYLVLTLIRKYPQAEGVKVHKPPVGSLEEMQYNPD